MAQRTKARQKVVTVFGSSRAEPGSSLYREAYELGRLLAKHGYVVCNGGYSGTMEAACRGCKEAGGRTIGVTVETFGGLAPNEFLDEEVGTASLFMRLDKLTSLGDAFFILGGGIGTLLEMSLVWNLRIMLIYPDKPIILLGSAWEKALEDISRYLEIRDTELAAFTFAERPEDAIATLAQATRALDVERAGTDWRG